LNPQAGEVLRQLCERGLVLRSTPALRLYSDEFHDFVIHAETARDVRAWERHDSTDWARGEIPVLGALAALGAFVFITQPQLLQTGAGMAAAATTVVGAATRVLRLLSAREGGERSVA
jgi:hypothetical protein